MRLHSSSGTTGKPIVVGYSRGDINTWTECTARVAAAAGVHRGDLVQMAFLYGMFTGGWGMHYGIERLGATIIPAGSARPNDTSPCSATSARPPSCPRPATPSTLPNKGRSWASTSRSCRCGLGCSAASPRPTRRGGRSRSRLHIRATDNYGLTEVIGPGVAGECECRCGLHINEDHFMWELVDPAHRRARRTGRGRGARLHQSDQRGVPGAQVSHA